MLLTADCKKFRGWFTGFINYEHEDGRLTAATITREGKEFGIIRYVYDPMGRLERETWDLGGQWSQTFTYKYEPIPLRVFSASSPW